MNGIKILDIVKSGGAIVLAAIALYMFYQFTTNHAHQTTEAIIGVKEAIVKMGEVVDRNTDQNARVERALIDLEKKIR